MKRKDHKLKKWLNLFSTKLKVRLMLFITLLVVVLVASGGWLAYNQSERILKENIFEAAEDIAVKDAALITEMIKSNIAVITNMNTVFFEERAQYMTDDMSLLVGVYWLNQESNYKKLAEEQKNFEDFFVSDIYGNARSTNGEADISERDYFKKAIETKEIVISRPILSKTSGNMVVVIVRPVVINNKLVAVIGASTTTKALQDSVIAMNINGNGYGFIIDEQMQTIAHPVEEYINQKAILEIGDQQLVEIANKMTAGESGSGYCKIDNRQNGIAFAPIGLTGWSLGITAAVDDIMAPLDVIRIGSVWIVLISILVALILSYLIAHFIARPIVNISGITESIADGDLTPVLDRSSLKSGNEVGNLARSVSKMIKNLRAMIEQVVNISDKVSASSEELYASGEQVGEVAEQVGTAIEGIASGAEEQSAQVEDLVSTVETFIRQIEEVGQNTAVMNKSADDVMERIKKGNDYVNNSVLQVGRVKKDSTEVADVIKSLGKASAEIGNIVELINGIAAQTNLLALNAAIEAARAGEAGRGFSVVADEIRELAEDSSSATKQIADLIKDIQKGVSEAVQKMDESIGSVDGSVKAIEVTGQEFKEIEEVTVNLKRTIEQVADNANHMADNSKRVEEAINDIATVSQEFAGSSEEVAASSEEQIAATDEIINSSRQLADMAEELTQTVKKFKL